MAITFRKLITPFSGNSPLTSPAYTPNAASDTLIFVSVYYAATFSGTGGTYTNSGGDFPYTDPAFDDASTGYLLSASASSQTVTVTGTAGQGLVVQGIDYSGISSVGAPTAVSSLSPGTGANAIAGTAVTVPSGSTLLAFCYNASSGTDTITTAGTNRGSGTGSDDFDMAYCWAEYAGSGASVTPQFTTSADGTDGFVVIQWVLAGSGGSGALAGSTSVTFGQAGAIKGSGALAASTAITSTASATAKGAGALIGAASVSFGASATGASVGALAGTAAVTFGQTGTVKGAGALSGSTAITFGANGSLVQGAISATAAMTTGASGALAGSGALVGTATVTTGTSAALSGAGSLAGSAGITSGAGATIVGLIATSGIATITSNSSGTLTGNNALAGTAAVAFGQSGALKGIGALTGSSAITFGATATGHALGQLAGQAAIATTASGTAKGLGALIGSASINFAATASPHLGAIAGTASITTGATGAVAGKGALAGTSAVQFGTAGAIQGIGALQGASSVSFSLSGTVESIGLSGLTAIEFGATGQLSATGALSGTAAITFGAEANWSSAHFGWANIVAIPQGKTRFGRSEYLAGSASVLAASFFDSQGKPFTPASVNYGIVDLNSGTVILTPTLIATATALTVEVTPEQNELISNSRHRETHQALFATTDTFGNLSLARTLFDIVAGTRNTGR